MKKLLSEIKKCTICEPHLDFGANPVVTAHKNSKIVIVGQAPGIKVHNSGIPWNDASGKQLRKWLNISDEDFYDAEKFAIIPMGFAIPAKVKVAINRHVKNVHLNGINHYLIKCQILKWLF